MKPVKTVLLSLIKKNTNLESRYYFLDPNNMHLVRDDYKDNPDFYHSLKAVQDGKVYTQIAYNWYTTNVEVAIADAYYAGTIIYPEQFKDIEIVEKANEIFVHMLRR